MRFDRLAVICFSIVGVLCLGGCSGGSASQQATAHLQGSVTLNGKPLDPGVTGAVIFRTTGQGQAPMVSVPVANGRYDSPATPMGPVRVSFSLEKPTGKFIQSERTTQPNEEKVNIVPEKYGMGIEMEIKEDNLQQDFDLQK